jgi:hypothetical protein
LGVWWGFIGSLVGVYTLGEMKSLCGRIIEGWGCFIGNIVVLFLNDEFSNIHFSFYFTKLTEFHVFDEKP